MNGIYIYITRSEDSPSIFWRLPRPAPVPRGVLSPKIIQDGGPTIDRDGATISAQKIEGLFTVYSILYSESFSSMDHLKNYKIQISILVNNQN